MGQNGSDDDGSEVEWVELPAARTAADWLAWDESLLEASEDQAERSEPCEKFWLWESKKTFVVVGFGQKVETEVNVNVCDERGIPILRRCSGGGAVVQGKGCLNYGVILEIPESGQLSTITGTNTWVMERNRRVMESIVVAPVLVRGHTDLATTRDGRELKFSGNAQRRKRRTLLFHGTLLCDFDLALIPQLLRRPSWAPEYRANREHSEFVTNLGIPCDIVHSVLAAAWGATRSAPGRPRDRSDIIPLLTSRYGQPEWHRRV